MDVRGWTGRGAAMSAAARAAHPSAPAALDFKHMPQHRSDCSPSTAAQNTASHASPAAGMCNSVLDTPMLDRLYGGRSRAPTTKHAAAAARAPSRPSAASSSASFFAAPAAPRAADPAPAAASNARLSKRQRVASPPSMKFPRTSNSNIAAPLPQPASQQAKDGIARAALSELYSAFKTCAVCDELIGVLDEKDAIVFEPKNLTPVMRALLSGKHIEPPLPSLLRQQYCVDESLSTLLLSPRGIVQRWPLQLNACASCWRVLQKQRVPPFAICNSFAIGTPPLELQQMTEIEQALITPIQRFARLVRLGMEGQIQIRGHMSSQKLDVAKVAAALPLRAEDIELRVLITSAFTSAQKERALKDYEVRGDRVRVALSWLKANNKVYSDMPIDGEALRRLPERAVPSGLVSVEDAQSGQGLDGGTAEGPSAAENKTYQLGATIRLPVSSGSFQDTAVALRSICTVNNKRQEKYAVSSSSEQHWSDSPTWFASSHPIQMPFGRGGPDEQRAVQVAQAACFRHYCRLSTRQFQGAKDALAMYDATAREAIRREVYLLAKWRTSNATDSAPFGVLSVQDLANAYSYSQGVADAQRSSRMAPPLPQRVSGDAKRFIETVTLCTHAPQHTKEHALRARASLFSMGYALGPATWWLTISPDDLGSLLVFDMARGERPERIPLAEVRSSILATQPGAAALAFERLQAIVIQFILGWDVKKRQPYRWIVREQQDQHDAGGLLGVCRAFAIANETQARGSLHMHILLWSHGQDNIAQRIRHRAASGDTQRACAELAKLLENAKTNSLTFGVRRRPAFAYIASFSPEVQRVCLSNSNLQFVTNHEVSFYMTMYATKINRDEANANAHVVNAFRRNIARVAGLDPNHVQAFSESLPRAAGVSQMLSATYGWTATDAVSSQAAAFYNLGGQTFVFSHEFGALSVRQGLAFLAGDPIVASVNKFGTASASILDYAYRPVGEQFDGLSWYEFVEHYEGIQKLKARRQVGGPDPADALPRDNADAAADGSEDDEEDVRQAPVPWRAKRRARASDRVRYPVSAGHPGAKFRDIAERTLGCIVSIIGNRLANIHELDNGARTDLADAREAYAKQVLVIFVPFRSVSDLKQLGETWWMAFQRHRAKLTANTALSAIISNMQRYHHEFTMTASDERVLADDADDEDPKMEAVMEDCIDGVDGEPTQSVENMPAAQAMLVRLERARIQPVARRDGEHVEQKAFEDALAIFQARKKVLFTDLVEEPVALLGNLPVVPTRIVRMAAEACQSLRYVPAAPGSARVTGISGNALEYPSISQASQRWGLNERQHYGFALICTAILDSKLAAILPRDLTAEANSQLLQARERCRNLATAARCSSRAQERKASGAGSEEPPTEITCDALFGFITGPAGTGKSRIIDAALDFARCWRCEEAICVTATTGASAALIGAQTWQSGVGVGIEDVPKAAPSKDKMREWSRRGVLIVDEIGMGGAKTIARLDARLRQLKDKTKRFGGVHVMVFGDFRQIKPVADIPVYVNPDASATSSDSANKNATAESRAVSVELQVKGHLIWTEEMNAGIELIVNERAAESKTYADLLERFANNSPTADDLRAINGRCITDCTHLPADTTVIVPTNEERVAINNRFFESYCQTHTITAATQSWQTRGALVINATIEAANHAVDLSRKMAYLRDTAFCGIKTQVVRASTGTALKEVVGRLRLIIGAPVMVLSNDQTISGIVNGTLATLVDVVLRPDAVVKINTRIAGGGGAHCVDAAHVSGLILRYADQKWANQNIFPCLPAGCFPLKLPNWRAVRVHIGGGFAEVRVKQFQCTPAFALTGNKVQGATLSNVLVANWRAPKRSIGADGWIYVVLSRVRRLQSIFALEPLQADANAYKPRLDIAAEMDRLRREIFERTLQFLRR